MRFSCIKTISSLSKKVFLWIQANKSYVKIDHVRSETISCLGLFEGLHPDFRNRDRFKFFCAQHISKYAPTITPAISIYPHAVYAGAGLHKAEEVASDMADDTIQVVGFYVTLIDM